MELLEIPLVWGKKAIAEFGRRSDRLLFCVKQRCGLPQRSQKDLA
ncbi:MAG: hypothetical protein V7K27_31665 [Nostoc sp.]